MLGLLLDEQISPVVARHLTAARQEMTVHSVHTWREGACAGVDDAIVLRAAADDGLTLVTYDCSTIPPVLRQWAELGLSHAGVIFVDERTIATSDFGGLIRALSALWSAERDHDWTNRVVYLTIARP